MVLDLLWSLSGLLGPILTHKPHRIVLHVTSLPLFVIGSLLVSSTKIWHRHITWAFMIIVYQLALTTCDRRFDSQGVSNLLLCTPNLGIVWLRPQRCFWVSVWIKVGWLESPLNFLTAIAGFNHNIYCLHLVCAIITMTKLILNVVLIPLNFTLSTFVVLKGLLSACISWFEPSLIQHLAGTAVATCWF